MADRIHASSEWLEKCAATLGGVEAAIRDADSALAQIDLRRDEGANLRVSLSFALSMNGMRFSSSSAADGIRELQRAVAALSAATADFAGATRNAARLFEGVERDAVQLLRSIGEGAGLPARGIEASPTPSRAAPSPAVQQRFADARYRGFVRAHEGFEHASDADIQALLSRLSLSGGGCAAFAAGMLSHYQGRGAEFERVFGFPMYDSSGEFNRDLLALDFFLATGGRYFLNTAMGPAALVNDVMLGYAGREAEFRERYGVELYADASGKRWSAKGMRRVLAAYDGRDTVELDADGMTPAALCNRVRHYMDVKGVDIDIEARFGASGEILPADEAEALINRGRTISVAAADGLFDARGNAVEPPDGARWYAVTGATEDGGYALSAWDERRTLRPEAASAPIACVVTTVNS